MCLPIMCYHTLRQVIIEILPWYVGILLQAYAASPLIYSGFFYKPGDRLGHALALGRDIESWIQDTETVAMPVQEHMENLLWIWGKGIEGEIELPIPMEQLEEKIVQCAEKIYQNISSITVRMLYQAYDKKFSS